MNNQITIFITTLMFVLTLITGGALLILAMAIILPLAVVSCMFSSDKEEQ